MTPKELEAIILEDFNYLFTDFGFVHISTIVHTPEIWCTFHNSSTEVVVLYEVGGQPWLELAELGDQAVAGNRTSLELLLKERAPLESVTLTRIAMDDDYTRRLIREKARQLREYGGDVLKGDFSMFPRLRELAEENLLRRTLTNT